MKIKENEKLIIWIIKAYTIKSQYNNYYPSGLRVKILNPKNT